MLLQHYKITSYSISKLKLAKELMHEIEDLHIRDNWS